jgi:hypothetical protein
MAAFRFRSFIPDSVTGISICFNDAFDNANRVGFDIMVWADDNGRPGTLLGSSDDPVAAQGDEINGFVTYLFDEPVWVNDNFWVGWRQNSEKFLNAGLDMNTLLAGRHYFMLSGIWQESQAPGTVMIRPVMKGSGSPVSSENGTLINGLYRLWPNPTSGQLTIVPAEGAPDDYLIDVISSAGALVMTIDRAEYTDLSHLADGSYLLLVRTVDGRPLSLLRVVKVN